MGKKRLCVVLLCLSLLLCSCGKQEENKTQSHIKTTEDTPFTSEIIPGPEALNAADTTASFVINTEDMPVMVNMLDDKKEQRVYYEVSYLKEDGTWDSEKPAQNLIIGKKWGEDLASCSIQCEGTLSASDPIIVKDGYGYVLTGSGIYGGKLTDKSWKCLLPKDKMESGYVQNFMKPAGHDSEFYCFQMKAEKQFEWVHYN